jgi:hypothetical protein
MGDVVQFPKDSPAATWVEEAMLAINIIDAIELFDEQEKAQVKKRVRAWVGKYPQLLEIRVPAELNSQSAELRAIIRESIVWHVQRIWSEFQKISLAERLELEIEIVRLKRQLGSAGN